MSDTKPGKTGMVYLVGAGPGDPGLITLRAVRCLETADVVVHDRLVDRRLLVHARRDAEVIDVRDVQGSGSDHQSNVSALLVARARQGRRVVRLKGGDPFLFGRGGEEALALARAGVPFTVVPGVTSALAAPAYAGIPVTYRDMASSVTVVTGSEAPDKSQHAVAWGELARAGGTLVVLMGRQHLGSIADTLVRHGRPAETPAALIEWGSEPHQRTVEGTLATIADQAETAAMRAPVVAVIGEVVGLRGSLRWFDSRPLFGKRVLVTRARAQAGRLSDLLALEGAEPIEAPAIETAPPDDYAPLDGAVQRLDAYDWVVFASVNTVKAVFDRMGELGRDARAFRSASVAALGSETAAALRARGIVADFVPETFVSEELVDGLTPSLTSGSRVLYPRSQIGRETTPRGLRALGVTVDEVTAYRTIAPEASAALVDRALSEGIDVVTFTSSSTVRNTVALLSGDVARLQKARIACIGPITAATARDVGLTVDIVAGEHTIAGLVDSITAHYSGRAHPNE